MYILDPRRQPVPARVSGEIYIGGIGVARGYLNRPELTAERFVPDPFGRTVGGRLYRTGDEGHWLPDGAIEFLGRNDFQVKLRGFRIELGEIEARLAEHPQVREAVVVAREDATGDQRLVAYYTSPALAGDEEQSISAALRAHLLARAPEYMAPGVYCRLEEMPLTPNGKLDRKALPAPEAGAYVTRQYEAPEGEVEEALARVWADVLQLERAGRHDHFFEMGGHSLLAVTLISRIRAVLGVDLSLRNLYETPTVAGLSAALGRTVATLRPPLRRMQRPAEIPLSYAQRGLWLLHCFEGPSPTYNLSIALRLKGQLDYGALRAALGDVIERHEILRTVFPEELGKPRQDVLEAAAARSNLQLPVVPETADTLKESLVSAGQHGFDLTTEIPIQARLFSLGADDHVLLLALHHIAADGFSMAPLVRDLSASYRARCQGRAPELPPLPVQYVDYTLWQLEMLGSEAEAGSRMAQQLAFWKAALHNLPDQLALPYARSRPAAPSSRGAYAPFRIGAALHGRLLNVARQGQASIHMALQAGLAALLTRFGAGCDLPIGSPVAGRLEPELEGMIGSFVNTIVLRTDTSGNPSLRELLSRVRTANLKAYAYQELPFEILVGALNPARALSLNPLFQVSLTLDQAHRWSPDRSDVITSIEPAPTNTAKVDLSFGLVERLAPDGAPQGIEGDLEYRTDLFDQTTAEAMASGLVDLLEQTASYPDQPIEHLK